MKWIGRLTIILSALGVIVFSELGWSASDSPRKRPTISFISPAGPGNTYWPSVFQVIDAVAAKLDFEFVHYDIGVTDRFVTEEKARAILTADKKPDALVISVVIGNAKPILDLAEKVKVPVVLLGPMFPIELKGVGYEPRNKYKYWIANLDQSEPLKGYLSAKNLFVKATETIFASQRYEATKAKKIQLLALGGKRWWIGSLQRDEGMNRALKEFPNIELLQMVPTDWGTEAAEAMTKKLLNRYPNADIVWAASDQMAEGAVRAFESRTGAQRGRPYLVSGIDMSEFGLKNVKSGRTVGSSSMSLFGMGEMMVYIYDYLQGLDFAPEIGTNMKPETVLATQDSAQQHLDFFKNIDKIDFRQFSKTHNPNLKKYNFSMEALNKATGKPSVSGKTKSR